jgi:hypothetical protein
MNRWCAIPDRCPGITPGGFTATRVDERRNSDIEAAAMVMMD